MGIILAKMTLFAGAGWIPERIQAGTGPYNPTPTWIGIIIASLLTLAMYSFLYKDNPVYKFGEHLYLGVTVGYFIGLEWFTVMWPLLIRPLKDDPQYYWYLVFPGILGVTMLFRFINSVAWVSRYALAFMVAVGAGLAIPAIIQASILQQMYATFKPLWIHGPNVMGTFQQLVYCFVIAAIVIGIVYAFLKIRIRGAAGIILRILFIAILIAMFIPKFSKSGGANPIFSLMVANWVSISAIIVFVGVLSVLVYFFFSLEHKGTLGKVSQIGIWFLMISFGASFGYTVMARISLLIGRMQFILQDLFGLKLG